MYFSGTYFYNFRNLYGERREWTPGFNLITGPNGAGKTNFLEGLNLISGWGPFDRGVRMSGLVSWSADDAERGASLSARIGGEDESEISALLGARFQLRCDGKALGSAGMRRRIPVLSFMPGHMSILKGGAVHRRRLMDIVGAIISPNYAKGLNEYRRVLRHRTALLRARRDPRMTDELLVRLGAWLWSAREEILRMIGREIENFSGLLPSPLDFFFERGGGVGEADPRDDFRRSLRAAAPRERASRTAIVGPQRDDIKFFCGGVEASLFLSRGQSRKAASALVLACALAVERRIGRKPVLIFDEIASELDKSGRDAAIGALLDTGCQVFAATADVFEHGGIEIHNMKDGRFV
jgi:DNA replication and repair protein RecF